MSRLVVSAGFGILTIEGKQMRHTIVISSLLATLFSACVAEKRDTTAASTSASAPEARPNILLIIGDDMGFSDVGAWEHARVSDR